MSASQRPHHERHGTAERSTIGRVSSLRYYMTSVYRRSHHLERVTADQSSRAQIRSPRSRLHRPRHDDRVSTIAQPRKRHNDRVPTLRHTNSDNKTTSDRFISDRVSAERFPTAASL